MPDTPRTVLCIDDDADDREIICYTIQGIDPSLEVVHAEDGAEALNYLAKAKQEAALPCLVILDINMPKKDGRQTLSEIKNDEQLRELPVVVFTTSNNDIDKKYCQHYGVQLITKPSSMTHMQQEVKQMLQPCVDDLVPKSSPYRA